MIRLTKNRVIVFFSILSLLLLFIIARFSVYFDTYFIYFTFYLLSALISGLLFYNFANIPGDNHFNHPLFKMSGGIVIGVFFIFFITKFILPVPINNTVLVGTNNNHSWTKNIRPQKKYDDVEIYYSNILQKPIFILNQKEEKNITIIEFKNNESLKYNVTIKIDGNYILE